MIRTEHLVLGYDKKAISKELNLNIAKGEYLCILGENGAGKSTLVKTLLGLIKPVSGNVFVEADKGIGYLPQQKLIDGDFPASVWEIVLSGNLKKSGLFYTRADRERCIHNLKRMNIWDLKDRSYRLLSGGQKQRVLLARALCATDHILILDEPMAGLDPLVTKELYELIERLNSEGLTIIMVSHDMKFAIQYAKSILHLGSDFMFYGRKEEYMQTDVYQAFSHINGGMS